MDVRVPLDEDLVVELHSALYDSLYQLLPVDIFKGITVDVRVKEHPPPHFHVKAGNLQASYSIEDFTKLNGNLDRYERAIRSWWQKNRHTLINVWNASRPSDCPVGPIRL
jgi:hypothetical protein